MVEPAAVPHGGCLRVGKPQPGGQPAAQLDLARRRYLGGEDDLTVLLQAQAAYSAADRLGIQARAAELQHLASLYKALGGGWEAIERR